MSLPSVAPPQTTTGGSSGDSSSGSSAPFVLGFDLSSGDSSSGPSAPLVLGFDLSTQSCKAVLAEAVSPFRLVAEASVNFEEDFPEYETTSGVINPGGSSEFFTPVLLWVEAFELCLTKLRNLGLNSGDSKAFSFANVIRVTGSAQQHGTVYLNDRVREQDESRSCGPSASSSSLRSATSQTGLTSWIEPMLYRTTAPIWMDMSTTTEAANLEAAFGWQNLTQMTGSRAYERFSGLQIAKEVAKKAKKILVEVEQQRLKCSEDEEKDQHQLTRVQLVSNFLCGLCTGNLALPIEVSDAAGMSILNLHTKKWDARVVEHLGIASKELLTPPNPRPRGENKETTVQESEEEDIVRTTITTSSTSSSSSSLSYNPAAQYQISPYLAEKYGFNRDKCTVLPWTGDNCSAIVGAQLFAEDELVISLGTSDTLLLLLPEALTKPKDTEDLNGGCSRFAIDLPPYGHIFPHPVLPGRFFAMLCYSNGDICRKTVRDMLANPRTTAQPRQVSSSKEGREEELELVPIEDAAKDHKKKEALKIEEQKVELPSTSLPVDPTAPSLELEIPQIRSTPSTTSSSPGARSRSKNLEVAVSSSPSISHVDEWDDAMTPAQLASRAWAKFDLLVQEAAPRPVVPASIIDDTSPSGGRGSGVASIIDDASGGTRGTSGRIKGVGDKFVGLFTVVDEICPPLKQFAGTQWTEAEIFSKKSGSCCTEETTSSTLVDEMMSPDEAEDGRGEVVTVPGMFATSSSSTSWNLLPEEKVIEGSTRTCSSSSSSSTRAKLCRSVLEGRALAMRRHASVFLPKKADEEGTTRKPRLRRITVAGGGARNAQFLQILADVFQTDIMVHENASNLCALGAVYRAVKPDARVDPAVFEENAHFVRHNKQLNAFYDELLEGYSFLEDEALGRYSRSER
ncbi:unnamed protein product [Amoebophrya sp. A25]|nr:unnamed protein product [Amoebophrya sp. A25]|eukprot:GSA25T00014694001.1